MPAEQRMLAERVLRPGERLLWCGVPDPSVRFTKADVFLVPFSILWAGFTIFWEAGVASTNSPGFFLIWGAAFVGMGLYITVGRFFYKARRKRRTTYLLTDQRAAVLVGNGQLSETPWHGMPKQVNRHRDGEHVDVIFDTPMSGRWGISGSYFNMGSAMYSNTGMDFFVRRNLGVAFFDVADGDSLLASIGQPPL